MKTRPRKPVIATNPLVIELFNIIDARPESLQEIGDMAGVHPNTMAHWRMKRYGLQLDSYRAVANALGYEVILRKKTDE